MNKNIKDHASKGGKKRADSLTAEKRSVIASTAAKARWDRYNEKKNHKCNVGCRCICGVYTQRHSRYTDCKELKCTKII